MIRFSRCGDCGVRGPTIGAMELVEIPKRLLLDARHGVLRIMHPSRQFPKPASDNVTDPGGGRTFQLYFDAGGERKLQIKGLDKASCLTHADWRFETSLSETDSLHTERGGRYSHFPDLRKTSQ